MRWLSLWLSISLFSSLSRTQVQTNIGVIHEQGHEESWIIAMGGKPDYYGPVAE